MTWTCLVMDWKLKSNEVDWNCSGSICVAGDWRRAQQTYRRGSVLFPQPVAYSRSDEPRLDASSDVVVLAHLSLSPRVFVLRLLSFLAAASPPSVFRVAGGAAMSSSHPAPLTRFKNVGVVEHDKNQPAQGGTHAR